ncbi:MAG TPA: EAL domain-containing protein [Streptosporangiaceae bacterium]|nr:EAL domain-containing protein [Streptosporangiaceae bacterium]
MSRGYRWLAGTAVFWFAGLLADQLFAGSFGGSGPLSLADVAPLLAMGPLVVGVTALASEPPDRGWPEGTEPVTTEGADARSILSALADGYVLAIALLVIGWVTLFGADYHHSGEGVGTFLEGLVHPLVDAAVLGMLLPALTASWRRVGLPYLALFILGVGDALGVSSRLASGHPSTAQQVTQILTFALLGLTPWISRAHVPDMRRLPRSIPGSGRIVGSGRPTVVAALAVAVATLVVLAREVMGNPDSALAVAVASRPAGLAVILAGGAALLVLVARVLVLIWETSAVLRVWRESSGSLRELADRTSDVVLVSDLDGQISYASPAVSDFGYSPDELTGMGLADLVHPEDLLMAVRATRTALGQSSDTASDTASDTTGGTAADTETLADEAPVDEAPVDGAEASRDEAGAPGPDADAPGQDEVTGRFPVRVRTADRTWRHIESTIMRYRVPGEPDQLLVTARDISDQVALRQQVTHLTFHDGLTGLPNRAYLEERARHGLRRRGDGTEAGVVFLDLDGFTAVNDSVGHGAGDLVLAQAARRLRAIVPSHDTVARWGGDEFAVLIDDAPGVQDIADVAERMAGTISSAPFRVADRDIALTASVGVALADGSPTGLVLRNADVAMSKAKDSGGGRVEVFAAHMHADVVRRLELASDLQGAISRQELTVQYQPVVDLETDKVTGAEALVRWWRDGAAVPPADFLDVAEDSGLIVPLGAWVLSTACAQGAAWRAEGRDVNVSVNLSARQINSPRFPESVAAALAESDLPPKALILEVTERVLVEDGGLMVERLADLRRLGVRLAIDDFGTGYASLAYLRGLPVDIIKIDPSFVAGLGHDDTLTLLTRTIVQVGHDLDIMVVAEGIENQRQLHMLREMGCGFGQGFLVARPMAAPGVESLINGAADPPSGHGGSPGHGGGTPGHGGDSPSHGGGTPGHGGGTPGHGGGSPGHGGGPPGHDDDTPGRSDSVAHSGAPTSGLPANPGGTNGHFPATDRATDRAADPGLARPGRTPAATA